MPSAQQKKRAEKKKQAEKERMAKKNNKKDDAEGAADAEVDKIADEVEDIDLASLNARGTAGVLASHALSADIHIHNFSMTFHGKPLIQDTSLELNNGNRYGLIGSNGCGKSTLLQALAEQDIPLQPHIDIFYLSREMPPSDKTPIDCVQEVDKERTMLEDEAAKMMVDDPENERLLQIYDRLDDLDVDKAAVRAARILKGLGFTHQMQNKKMSDFSGGWRMRVALARALFVKPYLLLLDEPTNHLDLNACVWLEQELKNFKNILVLVSHSQDFLNGVCSNILLMQQGKLSVYSGNYDTFVSTKSEQDESQMKLYKKEQADLAAMKEYVARFGHGSRKLAKQGKSKEKLMNKRIAEGMTEKVHREKTVTFKFTDIQKLPPPILSCNNVWFRYNQDTPWIYEDLEFGMDLDTRVALVGPNGAGKSTLLKLIAGELIPTDGMIKRHSHLKIARYHQHLAEKLDMTLSPLEYMMKEYPEIKEIEDMRKIVGRYGITGKNQVVPISSLSDGLRCRVALAWLARQNGHMLLLDEPTNHLDIETIDALADAIKAWNGGLVLVSHDFRLINQVAEEIWECNRGTITKWHGDIISYKENLIKSIDSEDYGIAQSADNRERKEPVRKETKPAAPSKPAVEIKPYTPSFKKAPATNGTSNGNSAPSTGSGGYVPPHLRAKMASAAEKRPQKSHDDDADWFNDD